MKKLRMDIDKWFERLDKRWQAFSLERQQQYTLCFFVGYLLLTTGVIFKIGTDIAKFDKSMTIEHIENPDIKKKESSASLQDTLATILKNKIYERK